VGEGWPCSHAHLLWEAVTPHLLWEVAVHPLLWSRIGVAAQPPSPIAARSGHVATPPRGDGVAV
jgi:hypothetical protein